MVVIVMLGVILVLAVGIVTWLWMRLQKDAEALQEKNVEPLADIKAMRPLQALDEERKKFEDEVSGLKQELGVAQARAQEQERITAEIITDLRAQCDTLRRNVIELESSSAATLPVAQDDGKLDHLRAENAAFRSQLDESALEIRRLKEGVAQLEKENELAKNSVDPAVDAQKLIDAARHEYQQQMENFYKEIEELRTDNVQLKEQAVAGAEVPALRLALDELSGKLQELESSGALLLEKNEYLQYELTKSRAEVVGLERLCENAAMMVHAEAGTAQRS